MEWLTTLSIFKRHLNNSKVPGHFWRARVVPYGRLSSDLASSCFYLLETCFHDGVSSIIIYLSSLTVLLLLHRLLLSFIKNICIAPFKKVLPTSAPLEWSVFRWEKNVKRLGPGIETKLKKELNSGTSGLHSPNYGLIVVCHQLMLQCALDNSVIEVTDYNYSYNSIESYLHYYYCYYYYCWNWFNELLCFLICLARFASTYRDGGHYFVLLILTDGVITDMPATLQAIISVSSMSSSLWSEIIRSIILAFIHSLSIFISSDINSEFASFGVCDLFHSWFFTLFIHTLLMDVHFVVHLYIAYYCSCCKWPLIMQALYKSPDEITSCNF